MMRVSYANALDKRSSWFCFVISSKTKCQSITYTLWNAYVVAV